MITSSPGRARDDVVKLRVIARDETRLSRGKGRFPMAETIAQLGVVRLSDLEDGMEAECFAVLASRTKGFTKRNEPYVRCVFRDRNRSLEAPVWASDPLIHQASLWVEGVAYRLHVRVEASRQYGLQIKIQTIRPASDELDSADGYSYYDLVESSAFPVAWLMGRIHLLIDKYISLAPLNLLVKSLLAEHSELFLKMPAASTMHHRYTAGLLEHVWSMTRISGFLADHYGQYYTRLNPPLDKGIIVAAAILHDIGKIRELEYDPVEAKYTKVGCLIGHVLLGRDMVREAARKIENFPEETLLLLEHAILSHHGKREFGAPILPQTIEAILVSFVDDLDAKLNAVAQERINSGPEGDFTDRVYPLDNRRIYKGIPLEPPVDDLSDLA